MVGEPQVGSDSRPYDQRDYMKISARDTWPERLDRHVVAQAFGGQAPLSLERAWLWRDERAESAAHRAEGFRHGLDALRSAGQQQK